MANRVCKPPPSTNPTQTSGGPALRSPGVYQRSRGRFHRPNVTAVAEKLGGIQSRRSARQSLPIRCAHHAPDCALRPQWVMAATLCRGLLTELARTKQKRSVQVPLCVVPAGWNPTLRRFSCGRRVMLVQATPSCGVKIRNPGGIRARLGALELFSSDESRLRNKKLDQWSGCSAASGAVHAEWRRLGFDGSGARSWL